MNMPMVEIRTTDARIGTNISRPPMQMKQRPAEVNIEQNLHDTVDISIKPAKVHIDQSEARRQKGMVPPLEQQSQWLQEAKQNVSEYMAKTAREGEQIKAIHENGGGGKVFAQLAKKNGRMFEHELEPGWIPKSIESVKFEVEPHDVRFDVERPQTRYDVQTHEPETNIPRWEVQHYLRQRSDISFDVRGLEVNRTL
ncbi:DUF6470 family protein [Salibacterium lacus]|uniref:DUF6470 family protein n=1 Tax=Salibacterium lacus TaxID=1898109 RepID=A0ABW5T2K7_9BACI